jgi:hypothetical protein
VHRSRKENDLSIPNAYIEEIEEKKRFFVRQYMSTDESEIKEIKGAHTKVFLTSEYEWVRKRMPQRFPPFNKDWSKKALLKKVVQGRHIIYGVESARSNRQTGLEMKFDAEHPVPDLDEEEVLAESTMEFYTGTEQSRDENKDTIKVDLTTQFKIPELDDSVKTFEGGDGSDDDVGEYMDDVGSVAHSSLPPPQFSQASSSGWSFSSSLFGSPKRKRNNN